MAPSIRGRSGKSHRKHLRGFVLVNELADFQSNGNRYGGGFESRRYEMEFCHFGLDWSAVTAGVDPYYLTHKSESLGYHPQIILAGRRMNDGMAAYVAEQLVKALLNARIHVRAAKVLILGLAFKENCPDIRNTKVVDLIGALRPYGVDIDVYDPWVDATEALDHCDVSVRSELINNSYDAIIIAVAHNQFKKMGGARIRELGRENHVLYDVKHMLPADQTDLRL